MADVTPDWAFESMKLQRQRKQIELNMFDCELRLLEMVAEKNRLEENLGASKSALAELDEQIAGIKDGEK